MALTTITGEIQAQPLNDNFSYLLNSIYENMPRQAVINGNFDIWQRGTSITNPTATGTFLTDKFGIASATDGWTFPANIIHSRQELTPGDMSNSYYFYRINPDGAGSGVLGATTSYCLYHRVEHGTRYLCGANKKVTLNFYAKSSITNKRLGMNLSQRYGSGGTPTSTENLLGTICNLTANWTYHTYAWTTNTLTGKTFGTANNDYLQLRFEYVWSSAYGTAQFGGTPTAETFVGSGNIDIAQVQLCVGDTVLPFVPKRYQDELNLCRRFNRRLTANSAYYCFGTGQAISTTAAKIFMPFGVQVRTTPTLSSSGTFCLTKSDGTYQQITAAITIDNTGIDGVWLTTTVSAVLTAGNATSLNAMNDTTAYLNFDAEIS
jgi:hypothetical protein